MKSLRIDVWSDIACPWCYVGKRRLEAALEGFEHAASVELVWRAFELDPSAPRVFDAAPTYVERLARKYGIPPAEAEAMIQRMTETAAADGLDFRFDRVRGGNTFDAHRLLCLAHERGAQDALKERFLLGYFTEGAAIGEKATLVRLAVEAGLDEPEVIEVVETDAYASEVRADQAEARAIGIRGVPFFVFAGRVAVSGAQGAETLGRVLDQAWALRAPVVAETEGAACTPDGCG